MEESIKQEVLDEASAIVHGNFLYDVPHLINIKEEFMLADSNTCVDTSKDLLFEVELKEDTKLKIFNEASSTLNAASTCIVSEVKDEISPAEPDAYVNYEISKVPSFNFQLKLENFDQQFCVKSEEVDIDIKLETDMQSGSAEATITQCAGNKSPQNSVCNYKCSQKRNAAQHMGNHTREKHLQCKICDYKCSRKSRLHQHMKVHAAQKPFQCSMCNYKSLWKCNLQTHMKTHTGEKQFSCSVCNYKSLQKSHLREHMKVHTGEKPFHCNVCDFKCSAKNSLQRHVKVHTAEKLFHCSMCNYKYSRNCDLQVHMNSHAGENPYLQYPTQTHTREKHFACSVCNYKTSWKSNLNKHMKTHTGE